MGGLVRRIYRANKYQEKTADLHQFQDGFELLKLEIRLCQDLRLINIRRYSELFPGYYKLVRKKRRVRKKDEKLPQALSRYYLAKN